MELVAWLTHKYIMHGIFWYFHKDHHTRENKGFFEKNDFFFLIFALPGSILIMYGIEIGIEFIPFWIGLGISTYGMAYFFVHDLFIHQRIKVLKNIPIWARPMYGLAKAQYGPGPWAGPMGPGLGPGPYIFGQEHFSETAS